MQSEVKRVEIQGPCCTRSLWCRWEAVRPQPVPGKPSGKVSPYSVPGGSKQRKGEKKKRGEQIIHSSNSSQCHVLHTYFNQRRWRRGEIGAEKRGRKKKGALRYKRKGGGCGKADGQTRGLVCFFFSSIAGDRAEHVLISHNATHYVISHYDLRRRLTSPHSRRPAASDLHLDSGAKGGEGRDCLGYFCTGEPEAAANLPLRTSAKSPQESRA